MPEAVLGPGWAVGAAVCLAHAPRPQGARDPRKRPRTAGLTRGGSPWDPCQGRHNWGERCHWPLVPGTPPQEGVVPQMPGLGRVARESLCEGGTLSPGTRPERPLCPSVPAARGLAGRGAGSAKGRGSQPPAASATASPGGQDIPGPLGLRWAHGLPPGELQGAGAGPSSTVSRAGADRGGVTHSPLDGRCPPPEHGCPTNTGVRGGQASDLRAPGSGSLPSPPLLAGDARRGAQMVFQKERAAWREPAQRHVFTLPGGAAGHMFVNVGAEADRGLQPPSHPHPPGRARPQGSPGLPSCPAGPPLCLPRLSGVREPPVFEIRVTRCGSPRPPSGPPRDVAGYGRGPGLTSQLASGAPAAGHLHRDRPWDSARGGYDSASPHTGPRLSQHAA